MGNVCAREHEGFLLKSREPSEATGEGKERAWGEERRSEAMHGQRGQT